MQIHILYVLVLPVILSLINPTTTKQMPDIELKDFNEKIVNIKEYTSADHVKLVTLWATWCGPCRKELNVIKDHYNAWSENYNLEVIAISLDDTRNVGRAQKLAEKSGWDFTFFHDHTGKLSVELGIKGIPYSLLLDQKGNIVSTMEGYYEGYEGNLENKMKKLTGNP